MRPYQFKFQLMNGKGASGKMDACGVQFKSSILISIMDLFRVR